MSGSGRRPVWRRQFLNASLTIKIGPSVTVRRLPLIPCQWTAAWGPELLRNRKGQTMSKFLKLIKNEKGATAIEYGLIAALIAVAAIGAMQGIGTKLSSTFTNVSNQLH